jgi:hypothetical protein
MQVYVRISAMLIALKSRAPHTQAAALDLLLDKYEAGVFRGQEVLLLVRALVRCDYYHAALRENMVDPRVAMAVTGLDALGGSRRE